MKNVIIVAPMEANGRYRGGIMSVANALYDSRGKFRQYDIELDKFNTYILQRKAETIGKFDFTNIRNMCAIMKGLLRKTKGSGCDSLYYHTSTRTALLKDLLVIRVLRLFGRRQKIILHIHFAEIDKILPGQKFLRAWILKALNRWTDRVAFLSAETKKEFEEAGLLSQKGFVLYNFHSGAITQAQLQSKRERVLEKEKVEFLFMGSVDRRKGILDLMRAMEQMPECAAVLHICGICNDDTVRQEFEILKERLGSRVICHGFVTGQEKERIMEQADCMVLPSYGEGFPLVLIDAMAYGCTCLTTPVGAVPEFFEEGTNGSLFEAGNVKQLANCMCRVIESRGLVSRQMENNYALSTGFSIDKFIEELQAVL